MNNNLRNDYFFEFVHLKILIPFNFYKLSIIFQQIQQYLQMNEQIKQIGNYTYNQRFCLGEGSFGKVYEGSSKTNKKVAIKRVEKKLINSDEYLKNSIQSEINILKKFNHPNIVKLEQVIFTANSIYIITQYCKNGDLKHYLRTKKPKEEECINIFTQLVNGFKQIVKQGIIHRDLKPPNILVHEGIFKICDFGFAKIFKQVNRMNRTSVGTPMYMSPQALKKKPYTNKSDIWSLGIVFYEMMFGKSPWQGGTEDELYQNIISKPLFLPSCSKISSTLLKNMLVVQQIERWSWQKIFEYVQSQIIEKKQQKQNQLKPSNEDSLMKFLKKFSAEQSKNVSSDGIIRQQNLCLSTQQQQKVISFKHRGRNTSNRQIKLKPKNMLAYFLEQQESTQNPRFCYFIIVQLYLSPLKVATFDLFLQALHQFTIQLYINNIKKQKGPYQQLLMIQLKQINQIQIPKIKIDEKLKARDLGISVLIECEKIANMSKEWIKRFVHHKYFYDPI